MTGKSYNDPSQDELVSASDLHHHVEEVRERNQREKREKDAARHRKELAARREFLDRDFTEEDRQHVMNLIRHAVHDGKMEVEVLRFPAWYLEDGGRAINNTEPDWPKSLCGYAAKCFEAYTRLVQPLGYKMIARVLDYPNGFIGTIALYLRW